MGWCHDGRLQGLKSADSATAPGEGATKNTPEEADKAWQRAEAHIADGRMQALTDFPLLVGPGGREAMFDGVEEADLALVDQRVLDGRILLVEYAPTG